MAKLGQQVDYYCGTCKMERYHTVAAIGEGGRIERLVCGYCHTPRKYRDPSAAKRSTPTTPRAPRAARVEVEVDSGAPAKSYAPAASFEKGDTLLHSKYGRGRVVEVRGDRIDVKFIDGETRVFKHTPPPQPKR